MSRDKLPHELFFPDFFTPPDIYQRLHIIIRQYIQVYQLLGMSKLVINSIWFNFFKPFSWHKTYVTTKSTDLNSRRHQFIFISTWCACMFPLFIRACMYQMQKSQFKLWGQPNLIIPIQGFWSASPAPNLISKSRFLIRLGNDPRVKEVVSLQRTLSAQWPWLPSIGQNLQSFTGNGDVSIWVGRKNLKHFWNFWIHRWCTCLLAIIWMFLCLFSNTSAIQFMSRHFDQSFVINQVPSLSARLANLFL